MLRFPISGDYLLNQPHDEAREVTFRPPEQQRLALSELRRGKALRDTQADVPSA